MFSTAKAMWRREPAARRFLIAQAQGSLGAGAGYVALLILAYDRIGSAWAATAVLLADLLPGMLLGPLLGALVDRTSRLGCAIAADLIRAGAFAGIVLVGGVAPMVGFALLAGLGTALFRPATYAMLPGLVAEERLAALNGLYGAARDAGMVLGPAVAGGLLLLGSPEAVLGLNAATFLATALLLTRLRGQVRPAATDPQQAPVSLRQTLAAPSVRALIGTSGAVTFASATMNVAELVLAERDLAVGAAGYALLVGVYGCGLVAGSLYAGREGDERRRHVAGIAVLGVGMVATALAPVLAAALVTFAATGFGNGLFVVSNRVLLQRAVPERLHGRAFGVLDAVDCWGFAGAVLAGGALATAAGGRVTFALSGAALLILFAAHVLRRAPEPAGRLATATA
jgi:MFS family permease